MVIVLGWLAVLSAAVGVGAHYLDTTATTLVVLASFAPVLMACAAAGLLALVSTRRWIGSVVAAAVLAVAVWTQLPLYVGDARPDGASDLTVMQANVYFGNSDMEGIVAQVKSRNVDILTVNELTPEAVPRLGEVGLDEVLPFRYLRPTELGGGTGIWSRHPISGQTEHMGFVMNMVSVRVIPPGQRPFVVVAAHPLPPVPRAQTGIWAREMVQVKDILQRLYQDAEPVIVGADFNSTYDNAQFRELLGDGYRDAAEQSGAGALRTYPADRWWPPVLAIDHVLVAGATATSAGVVDLPGSDHRGVVATVAVPALEGTAGLG
ncbi:endonuclease/exonuclease/phosphatase family protein [Rhodococcus spelaei]|uniref:endonuclease/exonuclease/phosphatase family protein n=1 Tax=Rhodococcus spelaei TaxID=2546320 RepID=UPI001FEB12F2|nr:endonuclease/exonuclease/phosphatase family protein [Rhodococcus spelaei]